MCRVCVCVCEHFSVYECHGVCMYSATHKEIGKCDCNVRLLAVIPVRLRVKA